MAGPTAPGRTFASDLIALAGVVSRALGDPRIVELAVPPADARGHDGEFCAVRLDCGDVGLAFVLLGDARDRLEPRRFSASDAPPAITLARALAGGSASQRAQALACVNALSQALMRAAAFAPAAAGDSFGGLAPEPGDRLGMVGFFPPLVRQALARGIDVTVVEMRSELSRDEPGLRVTTDRTALAPCNKVLCTSSVLLNDTLEAILEACAPDASIAIVGPSAGCLPDPLFARGVSFVAGTAIERPDVFTQRVSLGAPWGDAARKYAIGSRQWPGAERLLERIARAQRG
ncbi:MAG: hypothetical protein JSW68_06070 [Burkholderiales bacterium]|nr:MAG: hypothetical protein JSW68_06070 [Burkholderiales bacterium]